MGPRGGYFFEGFALRSREALDEAGTGAQDATHETFAQLDELLAELSAREPVSR